MKNTRKAAAIWLAMSLAISTAFGNTAWGEIRPDTGNNRCVHVHTAECYKDADETATPSQIGREPTECTHICSVESGCIRDIDLLRTGQHFLSARHPMRKIPQPQVEPSHRFHRRRSCHGLIRRRICLMADWSSPESLRKLSHPLQRSSSIYQRPLLPGWKKAKTAKTLKMGKKRIC